MAKSGGGPSVSLERWGYSLNQLVKKGFLTHIDPSALLPHLQQYGLSVEEKNMVMAEKGRQNQMSKLHFYILNRPSLCKGMKEGLNELHRPLRIVFECALNITVEKMCKEERRFRTVIRTLSRELDSLGEWAAPGLQEKGCLTADDANDIRRGASSLSSVLSNKNPEHWQRFVEFLRSRHSDMLQRMEKEFLTLPPSSADLASSRQDRNDDSLPKEDDDNVSAYKDEIEKLKSDIESQEKYLKKLDKQKTSMMNEAHQAHRRREAEKSRYDGLVAEVKKVNTELLNLIEEKKQLEKIKESIKKQTSDAKEGLKDAEQKLANLEKKVAAMQEAKEKLDKEIIALEEEHQKLRDDQSTRLQIEKTENEDRTPQETSRTKEPSIETSTKTLMKQKETKFFSGVASNIKFCQFEVNTDFIDIARRADKYTLPIKPHGSVAELAASAASYLHRSSDSLFVTIPVTRHLGESVMLVKDDKRPQWTGYVTEDRSKEFNGLVVKGKLQWQTLAGLDRFLVVANRRMVIRVSDRPLHPFLVSWTPLGRKTCEKFALSVGGQVGELKDSIAKWMGWKIPFSISRRTASVGDEEVFEVEDVDGKVGFCDANGSFKNLQSVNPQWKELDDTLVFVVVANKINCIRLQESKTPA